MINPMKSENGGSHRVGLNALLLNSGRGDSYRRAGIHSYRRGLMPYLQPADTRMTYAAFVCLLYTSDAADE